MSNKVKKPHVIRVVGVSCLNGTYKLNVSGRVNPLQLFQCAIPGESSFKFVKLPHVMSKRDAVAYLAKQSDHPDRPGVSRFLNGLLAKYDAVLNKVPGKRGRPKGSKNKKIKAKTIKPVKKAKVEVVKEIKAMIEPVNPTPVTPVMSDAEKQKIMEANREKLRAVARNMKQKVG